MSADSHGSSVLTYLTEQQLDGRASIDDSDQLGIVANGAWTAGAHRVDILVAGEKPSVMRAAWKNPVLVLAPLADGITSAFPVTVLLDGNAATGLRALLAPAVPLTQWAPGSQSIPLSNEVLQRPVDLSSVGLTSLILFANQPSASSRPGPIIGVTSDGHAVAAAQVGEQQTELAPVSASAAWAMIVQAVYNP